MTVFISIAVGVLDGLGLSMFLPLLQMVSGGGDFMNIKGLGKLDFIVTGIKSLGVGISLVSVLIVMFLFFLFKGFAKFYSGYYRVKVQQYFVKKLRISMLNNFNRISFKSFMTADVGRIQNSMTGEVDKIARSFAMYFATFEQVVLVVVYVSFAFVVDFRFAALVTIGGVLTNFIFEYFYKLTKVTSARLSFQANIYQGQVLQHVGNFKYLRATSLVHVFTKKLKETIDHIERSRTKIGIYSAYLQAIREPMIIGVVAIVILVQIKLLGADLGPILISLLFFYRSLNSLTVMQLSYNKFLENSGSLENVKSFQATIAKDVEANGTISISSVEKGIELKDASFHYREDINVLQNINLYIPKNESIAFVGESGSGKTTLVNILAGLLPVDEGAMLIDNINRNELDINSYQRRIGYVTQEPVIFSDTLFNNITFWSEPTPDNIKRFWKVVEQSSLSAFIEDLPEKEQSLVGNNGINVSGGQRQRISIARELFKDIDILILDEATSALDTETERSIQESIDILKGNYTLLIIAHRLSTVRNVDRVALLDKGIIVDMGSFSELRDRNSTFKNMVELQEIS